MFERNGVWTFSILGVWVQVRELPANNVAVFHPICEPVRQLVEPICRGRGYWNAQFRNWIIFEVFKDTVLAELGQIAGVR